MGDLVTDQIPSLFNGISQQPAELRLPSQCEDQTNCHATVARGLRKRPPFVHLSKISNNTSWLDSVYKFQTSNALYKIIDNRYGTFIVAVRNGVIEVWDLADGSSKTVRIATDAAYLTIPTDEKGRDLFDMVNIGDYSFIVNKTISVDTSVPEENAADLETNLDYSEWYFPENWGAASEDPYINDTTNRADQGSRQTFADLPDLKDTDGDPDPEVVTGDVWKLAGADEDGFSSYYVVADKSSGNEQWNETYAPGVDGSLGIDPTTMPHCLYYDEVADEFVFTLFPWKVRKVGDNSSNPPPTFVGRPIESVFYYKNRLGVIAGQNAVFSVAGDFGNFWRNTVTDILDSDVVDIAVSNNKIAELKHVVPFNNTLMLFSANAQYAVNVNEVLSPTTVSIDVVSQYDIDTGVAPIGLGSEAYFVGVHGEWSSVREYAILEDINSTEAADITSHVPRLIPFNLGGLTGSPNENFIAAWSDNAGDEDRIYTYQFHWRGNEKIQSAWQPWERLGYEEKVKYLEMLREKLYSVTERPDGLYVEHASLDVDEDNTAYDRPILLDRLVTDAECTVTYSAGSDETTIEVPWDFNTLELFAIGFVWTDAGDDFGKRVISTDFTSGGSANEIVLSGDHTGKQFALGIPYTQTYEFSRQFVKDGDNAIKQGTLMMRSMSVSYRGTAEFQYRVYPIGDYFEAGESPPYVTVRPAKKATGNPYPTDNTYKTSKPGFDSGFWRIPMAGNSELVKLVLYNSSPFNATFDSASWEAFFTKRSRTL